MEYSMKNIDGTFTERVAAKLRAGTGRELGRAGFDACFETWQITRFDHREHWGGYLGAPK
jgi:hypothetical protein